MARRWCKTPKTFFFIHLCEAPDFDKGQDCWPPCDSVFIPMYNKRYISKPKKIKKLDQFLERLIPPCHSFLLPVFLAEFPSGAWMLFHVIQVIQPLSSTNLPTTLSVSNLSIYLWLNMYFSKDADSVPTFESPWNHRGWTPALFRIFSGASSSSSVLFVCQRNKVSMLHTSM